MSSPLPQNVKALEPALFVTTQTTIPILTQLMAGFSLAVLGIAASISTSSPLPLTLSTRNVSLIFISVAALFFLFATEACVKSQAWDYFALSDERRSFVRTTRQGISVKLSQDQLYKETCLKETERWHKIAIWSYRIGVVLIVLGMVFLFWPISKPVSTVVFLYLPASLILSLIVRCRENRIV